MSTSSNPHPVSVKTRLAKFAALLAVTATLGWLANLAGIAAEGRQLVAVCTFIAVICTTLFFWEYRLAAAFLGIALLIATRVFTLKGLLAATELDIILFLIGMMTIVGVLKDLGLFTWIIQTVIGLRRMNGWLFTLILGLLSAVMASLVDEVTSIIVMLALVFQVCDTLKLKPAPFVLIAVMATNIGSSATMLGNPVGVFIGTKAGFSFGYFLEHATPVAAVCILVAITACMIWYRREIRLMSVRMIERRAANEGLGPLFRIPHRRGLAILLGTVALIACHHRFELLLGLVGPGVLPDIAAQNKNAFLIVTPLIVAGLLMFYRPNRARHYIEHEVEWWTLLFFMMLFAVAGGLAQQGVTAELANKLNAMVTGGPQAMVPFVLFISAVGSAFVDNIVFVAAFTPVIQVLQNTDPGFSLLWWALLFGACFGGNITAIGSTANIVALGMYEKRYHAQVGFLEWLKIGSIVGLLTGLTAWGLMAALPAFAPEGTPHPTRPALSAPAP
jgi:Na+/H+ antiporter NhaD/arsenite permease-like protein